MYNTDDTVNFLLNACYNARSLQAAPASARSLHARCSDASRERNIAQRRRMKSSRSSIKTVAFAKLMYAAASSTGLETSFQAGATNFARSCADACFLSFLLNRSSTRRNRTSMLLPSWNFFKRIYSLDLGLPSRERHHRLTQFSPVFLYSVEVWHRWHRYDSFQRRSAAKSVSWLRFCVSHDANESRPLALYLLQWTKGCFRVPRNAIMTRFLSFI